jgi:hypothetical protein
MMSLKIAVFWHVKLCRMVKMLVAEGSAASIIMLDNGYGGSEIL